MSSAPLVRRTLSDDASQLLREWILSGSLSPNDELSEPQLASRLGISRTPLRAAIRRLQFEGLLDVETGKGFRVVRPDPTMVREIYPVIGALEAMALRLSAPDHLPDVGALRRLNKQIAAGVSRARLFELDRDFHRALSAGCPNLRLMELLEHHRRLARLVDGAARRGMHKPVRSRGEHLGIVNDLARNRIDRAAQNLERHWLRGIDTVLEWMKEA